MSAVEHPRAAEVRVEPLRVSGQVHYAGRDFDVVNYSYLVIHRATGQALIVDPAWELDTIEGALRSADATLEGVLLTHSHFDHVNLVAPLVARHGADVWMSREELQFYRFSCPNLRAIDSEEPFTVAGMHVTPVLTPGHSRGSTCFFVGDNLFCGDTLFTEGCGACIGEGANPLEMFQSLQRLKARCGPGVRVFPGHSFGEPVGKTFELVRQNNIYLQLESYEPFHSLRMRSHQPRILDFK
uniref:Putative hydrolase n=1 Tax=Pyxidicoccus sp. MCy9557 TaxID=2012863 RepID=A0A1Z2TJL9_9BACT|nr:putative hydrolase [Pyxidicoccus sp. MCy9557]